MSQVVNIQDSIDVIPDGATNTSNMTASSSYPSSNALTDHTSTTYARYSLSRSTAGYTHYTFDVSGIPSGATITSVTAQVKVRINSTTYVTNTVCQLYANTTAKGSSYTFASTSSSNVVNMTNTGSWTLSELENLRLRIGGTGNNSSNSKYIYMYGATITINYSITGTQYTLISSSDVSGVLISPAAATAMGGESVTFTINPGSLTTNDFVVKDNDIDVTANLESEQIGGNGSISAVPGSNVTTGHARSGGAFYQSSSTSSDAWLRYAIGHSAEEPYSTSNTSNTYSKDGTNDSTTQSWMIYPFDFSEIPVNATITSVQVKCYGAAESTSETARHSDISLWCGNTQKGTTQSFTSTSNSSITISDVGTWTREELQDAKLRFGVGYYGGRLLGVTWTVSYTAPVVTIYTYTVSNMSDDHEIVIEHEGGPYIPPEEDPTKDYFPITISSINATTTPANGSTRVESGSNQVITISPTDPQLTLALDNGVDITSQLQGGAPNNSYTVATASGASYGFNLNSSTGYYTSTNAGVASSAAVARVTFTLETACTVTFSYINYAQAGYDYGIFGRIDTALDTTYTADSNPYLSCSASSYNISTVQTLSYEMSAGTHYIDVKYRKNSSTNSNNDNLQFKIDLQATGTSGDYTYTLTNIDRKHSLIFIFGDVNYYFINSSGNNTKLYPDGQVVVLQGNSYKLAIIPNDDQATITVTDNGTNVTNSLVFEEGYDDDNNHIVNYTYNLSNVAAAHEIVVTAVSAGQKVIYVKVNGTWTPCSKVYKKINGSWVEQTNANWTTALPTNVQYRTIIDR